MSELNEKVQSSIQRMKAFEPPEGYLLAFSGGKDSVVLKALADMSGVKYTAHYNVTSVDPPELVRFIREQYPDVVWEYPRYSDGKRITMWNLIPRKYLPPTRVVRYCCSNLKEFFGVGRYTLTGVRWAESSRRAAAHGLLTMPNARPKTTPDGFERSKRGGIILNNDNEDARRVLETCYAKQKKMVNPIVDWEDSDIWEFIKAENVPYCGLYDEGFKRLGCIGCPMAGKHRKIEFDRWPRYKQLYLNAFARMQEARVAAGKAPLCADLVQNPTPQDIFDWWMEEPWLIGQMSMFEEGER